MSYTERLRDPRWQKKRLQILERDGWKCQECGATESTLEVDHLIYAPSGRPWEVDDQGLRTLCSDCHERVTKLRRVARAVVGTLGSRELLSLLKVFEFRDEIHARKASGELKSLSECLDGLEHYWGLVQP